MLINDGISPLGGILLTSRDATSAVAVHLLASFASAALDPMRIDEIGVCGVVAIGTPDSAVATCSVGENEMLVSLLCCSVMSEFLASES